MLTYYVKLPTGAPPTAHVMRLRPMVGQPPIKRPFSSGSSTYDVVVIGAGPAGYVASIKAAQLGLKAACVEGRETLGGTCLNVGCIPSKSLLHNSYLYHMAKTEFKKRGIDVSGLSVNIPQMIKAKEQSVNALAMGISGLFKKNKIDWIKGWGKIVSSDTVEAKNPVSGETRTLKAKNIIIATGSEPTSFPGIMIDEEKILSSTGALSLKSIPEKMVVLGGGVIGLELGSLWSRLGTKVTVVEFLDSIGGPAMDSSISKLFANILKKQGLTIKTGTKAVGFKKSDDGNITLETESVADKSKSEEIGDTLLVAIGRKPCTKHLGLENVGIKPNKGGQIDVDESFTTCVPSIKAIGDVIRGPMLAHKAEEEGVAVIEYIAEGHAEVNYDAIPSVIYTHPEVAWVGKTEDQVKDLKIEYKVGTFPFVANSRAKTVDDSEGVVKVISQKSDDKILGIHLIGPSAGEIINEAVLALGYGASSEDIARTCHAHPTFSEALKEACMATCGKAIHS